MLPRAGESREGEEEEGDRGGEQREGSTEGRGMGRSCGESQGRSCIPAPPWDVDVGDRPGLWRRKGDGCWQWPSRPRCCRVGVGEAEG